jgi:hypothetical protein
MYGHGRRCRLNRDLRYWTCFFIGLIIGGMAAEVAVNEWIGADTFWLWQSLPVWIGCSVGAFTGIGIALRRWY